MINSIIKELSEKSSVSFLNIKIFIKPKKPLNKKITKMINKVMMTLYSKKLTEEKTKNMLMND